jgi:hypothetical protein
MNKTVFRITKVTANQPELDEYVDARDLDLIYEALDLYRDELTNDTVRERVALLQHLLYRLGD